ncbi:MAG: hypothetical protein HFJ46_00800 [Clostridia bacterium]|nr:hypothetical protein [Clostridia bacterium]
MKNAFILILFLILTSSIFYIQNIFILLFSLLLTFLIYIFLKISIIEILNYNKHIFLFFILIVTAFNLLLDNFVNTLIIDLRLLVACNLTYIIRFILPTYKLLNAIETLFKPLRIFKINTSKLSIVLNIGINFIPILINELNEINALLISKGVTNISSRFKYISKLILPTIFKMTMNLDYSLKAKNFIE